MQLRASMSAIRLLVGVALLPVLALWLFGGVMVMPPLWVHFYGVGVSALVAAAAALVLTTIGARRGDARTVVMAGGFTIMAAILAVHGLVTPGVLVGQNGVVALTGAGTLPVGAAVLALSTMAVVNERRSIPGLLGLVAATVAIVLAVSLLGVLVPRLVPGVPDARSTAAWILLAFGLFLFGALAIRAANTFLLTRRIADLAVVVGLVLLACSLFGALALTFMDLGWWIGHLFELIGIALVGASVAYDLRRGSQSRPLVGDLRAAEVVSAEEAFLGARVRAIMVRLAEKDSSTEEHTRRVAALAVEVGEALGLSGARLRDLAIGGLLHDVGKLSVPSSILQKPGPLDDAEFEVIKQHPQQGRELLAELGGFDDRVGRLVLDHHERLDGSGYPRGLSGDELDLETRIMAVCDVYDALVSPRVYRGAWSNSRALALLQEESGTAFDPRCVAALMSVVSRENTAVQVA
jgi:HD-GYP domain-containing protein (c-di-GMP phosphodiesterase class II)